MRTFLKTTLTLYMILWCYALGYTQNASGISLMHFSTPRIGNQFDILDKSSVGMQSVQSLLRIPQANMNCGLKVQPFFCRVESQIERKSGLAPRFRLGSLDYTNWLEGKTKWKE